MSIVHDKSKYHIATVKEHGLPEAHASHHALVFLRWLIEKNLMSEQFMAEREPLDAYLAQKKSLLELYEWWDCSLMDEMLSPEGNAFAQHYFDFEKGKYASEYSDVLGGSFPTIFHVEFTEENYQVMKKKIDSAYEAWKNPKKPWWKF